MRQKLLIVLLLELALTALSAQAQPARIDTTDVLFGVADRLRADGHDQDADRLLDLIRKFYPRLDSTHVIAAKPVELSMQPMASDGATELIVWSTFYGAALGIIVPGALGAESPEPYGAGILLGAPLGYGLSKYYTKHQSVTKGQARAMTFGSWWGALQALGWREVFDIGDRTERVCFEQPEGTECFEYGTVSDEAPYTALLIGGLTGLTAGTVLGRNVPITGETALITNFGAIWGSWFGTVLGVQLDQDEASNLNDDDDDTIVTTILVSGNIGLLAGALAGPASGWSTRDAWTIHMSGIAGLIGGIGIDLLASVSDENMGFLIPGLTSAAALIAAATIVGQSERDATNEYSPRSALIDFSGGEWAAGVPTPRPTLIPVLEDGKRRYRPAAQVSVLRMNW